MGLLDNILGQVLGGAQPGQQQSLANAVMKMLGNQSAGGIGGLLKMFTQQGFGDQVQSWIGTGQNRPITPDQITAALGKDRVAQIARESGVETNAASAGLAELIPGFVDRLTPNGQLPQQQSDLDNGLAALRKMLS
jgi:uncharacterized protein YidB (DUF937 family)